METVKLIFTQFNDETLYISSLVLLIILIFLFSLWFYHRKKYHQFLHHIPASVVKNYLDTIIQNSTALKSSLFRGGGMEIGSGIPSVIPLSHLSGGGSSLEVSSEALNQKSAEISSLHHQILEKAQVIRDLEKQMDRLKSSGGGNSAELVKEISQLKEALANEQKKNAQEGMSGGSLEALEKDRDDLKTKLKEYEIIEDDLANLKKLQAENEELKKKLGLPTETAKKEEKAPLKDAAAAIATAAVVEEVIAAPPQEETNAKADEISGEADDSGDEKSAEDLLSEFEKMLE